MKDSVTLDVSTPYAVASACRTAELSAGCSWSVWTRTPSDPTDDTRAGTGVTVATASLAMSCDCDCTPLTVYSDPPVNSIPNVKPPRTSGPRTEMRMQIAAMEYQRRRRPTMSNERLPV